MTREVPKSTKEREDKSEGLYSELRGEGEEEADEREMRNDRVRGLELPITIH